jgi:hypothetical protein
MYIPPPSQPKKNHSKPNHVNYFYDTVKQQEDLVEVNFNSLTFEFPQLNFEFPN